MKKNLKEKIGFLFNAAGQFTMPGTSGTSPVQSFFDPNMTLPQFFNVAFKTALVIGAMLAVARLVYAGFVYMTTDLPGMKGDAKGIIGETMTGLMLLLAVALILELINPQLLNLNILQSASGASGVPSSSTLAPPPSTSASASKDGGAFGAFCPQGQAWTGTYCSTEAIFLTPGAYNHYNTPPSDAWCYQRSSFATGIGGSRYTCYSTQNSCSAAGGTGYSCSQF